MPGGTAHLWARGTPGGLGLVVLSLLPPSVPGAPLSLLIAGADPTCEVFLSAPASLTLEAFDELPITGIGARADHFLRLPAQSWVLGSAVHAQWFDLAQDATSNVTTCTISASMPTLGMATIQGLASASSGAVRQHTAHVLQFEWQTP